MIPSIQKNQFIDSVIRNNSDNTAKESYLKDAKEIISEVKQFGDKAVRKYIAKFDGDAPTYFEVSKEEREEAWSKLDKSLVESLQKAAKNIQSFHEKQKNTSRMMEVDEDIISGQLYRPIEKVGIYVPGGTACYPSSVLMNAIPAVIAGVQEIVMVTPVKNGEEISPILAVAADIAGVTKIYRVGGVQAIAALAYGTETIAKVDKIVGPGNAYVAAAKQLVYGDVGIDMIAGPSEVAIIADDSANPIFVAADLIAQAEHDVNARAFLITTSEQLITKVNEELRKQCEELPRQDIATKSLRDKGASVLVDSIEEAFYIANQLAPEHLEVQLNDPLSYLPKIKHAGSVFLGHYTPEALGDYFAGPNHVLPTSGTAKFSSGLSVDDFVKKTTYLYYSEQALREASEHVVNIANEEELEGHGKAVLKRIGG
ncbi:histidinol dehydrogenase [Gracilibacillus marinus]|uniref:Histidinol dehydrogenase n=1 Tax=Gracilibacillus marinus TaxID=630535 RepID=A0ABV8VSZ7_9BACI